MAILKDGILSGLIGPAVAYGRNGKQVVKSRGKRVKQTKATKTSAKSFGKIKAISAELRHGLHVILPNFLSMPVMYAMDRAVSGWYRDIYPALTSNATGFAHFTSLQLNKDSSPSAISYLGAMPDVSWNGTNKASLHIGDIDLTAVMVPREATELALTLVVTASKIKQPMAYGTNKVHRIEKAIINNSIEAVDLSFEFTPATDCLYLAFLQIQYKALGEWLEENKWKPLLLVGSCYRSE